MKVERFEDLEIWQEARELCKYIFTLTFKEPFSRDYKFRDHISFTVPFYSKRLLQRNPIARIQSIRL